MLGLIIQVAMVCCAPTFAPAEDMIVYTAHQSWESRIYLLDMSGNVIEYFEYEFYRLMDLETVGNEVHVTDAFAPRSFLVDLQNGGLDTIIDDWTLYYFYGLAWDGVFFYVDEWDLNRYDIDGVKDGTASFDGAVYGSAFVDGLCYMIGDENLVTCWDLSQWPTITAVPENNFTPPSADCRGLWYDGRYFWSAESKDTLGYIYQFDYQGTVVRQILEPAFSGWAACVVSDATGLPRDSSLPPRRPRLEPGFPNPFNPQTTIEFVLPRATHATVSVHDAVGRRVAVLVDADLGAGAHRCRWHADGMASGVYYSRLATPEHSATRKMTLLK